MTVGKTVDGLIKATSLSRVSQTTHMSLSRSPSPTAAAGLVTPQSLRKRARDHDNDQQPVRQQLVDYVEVVSVTCLFLKDGSTVITTPHADRLILAMTGQPLPRERQVVVWEARGGRGCRELGRPQCLLNQGVRGLGSRQCEEHRMEANHSLLHRRRPRLSHREGTHSRSRGASLEATSC